ncbi:MAG: GDSL-type esterase/lipase family protein [Kiritimatiellaeota bacterium]|nr:GDSL-type esterase/lipase family protein [Kiritimatiellota bacterium]
MTNVLRRMLLFGHAGLPVALLLFVLGCGGGDGGNQAPVLDDFGGNDPNVVVAFGDSITEGVDGGGAPYPGRLAALSGRRVINAGVGGQESGPGLSRLGGTLAARKPGYLCILFGANDVIRGYDQNTTIANLQAMLQKARANKTVPILATLTPMIGGHGIWGSTVNRLNDAIRNLASAEGVTLVDLNAEFGDAEVLLIGDGLHPNDQGNQVIALAFNDALPH